MCSGRERSAKKLQYRAARRSAQSYWGQASAVPEESGILGAGGRAESTVPGGMGLQSGEWGGWSSVSGPEGMKAGGHLQGC